MKFVTGAILAFSFMLSIAYADTLFSDQQIIQNYNACMKLLTLSPEKQAEVAARSHKPLVPLILSCRSDKRLGLQEMLRLNREYNDWARHKHDGGGSGSSSSARSCVWTSQCIGDEQCIGYGASGTCQSVQGGCDNASNSCVAGERCEAGVCKNW